ncbi:PD-(D/E)XK nuclease family protein [Alphaproteobacteria bacterium]|nr:PD-(D/E)XK nuclease family protein [Alphaproteobacteria bacterium]
MIKLSRSAIEQYLNCKRCFILMYKYKVRLNSLPFTLNSAVDNLCKNEFDYYRDKQKPHPIFLEHHIDAVPFKHENIDKWRNNFHGISHYDSETDVHFYGAVDDVWVKPDGELILSDVKSTSKNNFDWDDTWNKYEYPKAYRRQLEMYQWLFRKNGFKVSDTAYLVYFNGLKNEPMFNQTLKFELHLIKLDCNDNWVSKTISEAKNLMDQDIYPEGSFGCDTCRYLKKRWDVSQKI